MLFSPHWMMTFSAARSRACRCLAPVARRSCGGWHLAWQPDWHLAWQPGLVGSRVGRRAVGNSGASMYSVSQC